MKHMSNNGKYLQTVTFSDMIMPYLYEKGGNHDRHGRIHHAGGGSEESAFACGYRQAAATYWRDARLQDRQPMAHQAHRTERVSGEAQEHEVRQVGLVVEATGQKCERRLNAIFLLSSFNRLRTLCPFFYDTACMSMSSSGGDVNSQVRMRYGSTDKKAFSLNDAFHHYR